jgi:uncharacterized Tic20 family protein
MNTQEPMTPNASSVDQETRLWAMLLHLSVFAGYALPIAGLVAPVVIWQVRKVDLPQIDVHGKIVVNWIISMALYGAVSILLVFVLIGIPLLILLGLLGLVFPIIGGIKASNGEAWHYPLSIQFLK